MKKIQMTGVATATTTNGNGNGKKANTPKDNVRVDENFDTEIKITPRFGYLSTKGVEMFTNMSNLENAKLFIDGLAMQLQNDTEMAGLLMILDSIKRKLGGEDSDYLGAEDYINWLQDYIFNWTSAASDCKTTYIDAVRSGNFVVGETRADDNEVWAEGIYPPKYKQKAKDSESRAEINALTATVKALQEQISGFANIITGKPQNKSLATKPADFEGLWLGEVFKEEDWMIPNFTLFLEVQQFPGEPDSRVISSVYERRIDGDVGLEIERLNDSPDEYPYTHESGKRELKTSPQTVETEPQAKSGRYQLCELISQVFNHPDMPKDLVTNLWNMISDKADNDIDSPEYIGMLLFDDFNLKGSSENKTGDLATHLSAILNNPETPEKLYEVISDELSSLFDGSELSKTVNSEDFIRKALKQKETATA